MVVEIAYKIQKNNSYAIGKCNRVSHDQQYFVDFFSYKYKERFLKMKKENNECMLYEYYDNMR